jgi:signal transduction histidine kinase
MLLEYARKSCSARLALLFTLDEKRQALALLAYSGRLRHPSSFSPETTPVELSMQGLFASALQHEEFVDIADISQNPLSLPEERELAWPRGRVLLHALRQGQRQGVLVFCFSPAGSRVVINPEMEEELLICSSLLSAYLSAEEELQPVRRVASDQRSLEEQTLLEEERSRIAREMHDSVVQDITHVIQKLDYIQRIWEKQPQMALDELEQARQLLNRSLCDLRHSISALLPLSLQEMEFGEALKALLHEYSLDAPQIKITSDMDNLDLWPQVLHLPVYRFIQEALNNIRKHASASEVSIRVHQVAGLGLVEVSDNGRGFVPEQVRFKTRQAQSVTLRMGLLAMEERIRQAGGVLEIQSKPGEGTTLKARFSLSQSASILTEREREVLRLLVDGLTNRAISERLSVSLETVKSHVHHIMQKMRVKDRTQAAVVATRQQWL